VTNDHTGGTGRTPGAPFSSPYPTFAAIAGPAPETTPQAAPDVAAIQLVDIVKRFPGVVANDGVNVTVRPGTIHALVGENGAGKSTVMKILYGAQQPDEGHILIDGTEHHFKSPREAIAAGVGMVFQHFMLADNLTVWENVVLGAEPRKGLRLDEAAARARINQLAADNGMAINADAYVGDLGVGERQRVEILKVLYRGARIIILDEPTAVLVPQEVDELFVSLRELTAQGVTIVFISHKLDEVLAIADEITVIRRGRTVSTVQPVDVTARDLAELMVGSELPSPDTRTSTVTTEVALSVTGLGIAGSAGSRPVLSDISFSVHKGEIVGIAGVEGNGQTELLEAILGTHTISAGRLELDGRDLADVDTRTRRGLGLGFIPEDRQRDGLLLSQPLWENVMLGYQHEPPFAHGPWIDKAAGRTRAGQVVREYDVRTPGVDTMALALSGGNQQKLIVGREMTASPRVLVAAHPTRGIDVGAQAAVWDAMRDARDKGLAILLVSADLDELIGLSDTLLVMLRGQIVARLNPASVTKSTLGEYMTGARGNGVAA
jgi:general nucleoside transport system ATP-binding protein